MKKQADTMISEPTLIYKPHTVQTVHKRSHEVSIFTSATVPLACALSSVTYVLCDTRYHFYFNSLMIKLYIMSEICPSFDTIYSLNGTFIIYFFILLLENIVSLSLLYIHICEGYKEKVFAFFCL